MGSDVGCGVGSDVGFDVGSGVGFGVGFGVGSGVGFGAAINLAAVCPDVFSSANAGIAESAIIVQIISDAKSKLVIFFIINASFV